MSQNVQTHFKNPAANAARFLKCVWPFWDIMHQRVNGNIAAPCVWKVFWDKSLICFIFRSILSQMIFKIGALKNIGNFTEKYLCWSLFSRKFIKKTEKTPTQVFSCEIHSYYLSEFSKLIFFEGKICSSWWYVSLGRNCWCIPYMHCVIMPK